MSADNPLPDVYLLMSHDLAGRIDHTTGTEKVIRQFSSYKAAVTAIILYVANRFTMISSLRAKRRQNIIFPQRQKNI